jgi:hypothetical protein
MMTIKNKRRFDDVGEQDADGFYDYIYRGFYYEIAMGERVFHVRTYDDEPSVAIVVRPTQARTSSEARPLVEFLIATLGCTRIKFYAPDGGYRFIDNATLEFAAHEPDAA